MDGMSDFLIKYMVYLSNDLDSYLLTGHYTNANKDRYFVDQRSIIAKKDDAKYNLS